MVFISALSYWSYKTNPFHDNTIFQPAFSTEIIDDEIRLVKHHDYIGRQSLFHRALAYYKSGFHISNAGVVGEELKDCRDTDTIIAAIHEERFNPETNPHVITGGHFNVLFARNSGVFYYPLVDPVAALDGGDWENRQRVALQTLAHTLAGYDACGELTTTVVPLGKTSVSCINIYNYPSDTLLSVYWLLDVLSGNNAWWERYYFQSQEQNQIQNQIQGLKQNQLRTQAAARVVLAEYRDTLKSLTADYVETVYDVESGLIKKDVALASAKDAVERESSFYDNVVFWQTMQLADKYEIFEFDEAEQAKLKARILNNFWLAEDGFFLDDLSEVSIEEKHYSSDWMVVNWTGFLDIHDDVERKYFTRVVDHIRASGLASPLPIKYQDGERDNVWFMQLFGADYQATSDNIWSFWGAEYIKILIQLAGFDEDESQGRDAASQLPYSRASYLEEAQKHLQSFEDRMNKYCGFPELYDGEGKLFESMFFGAVRRTGWVVNIEQAKKMYQMSAE